MALHRLASTVHIALACLALLQCTCATPSVTDGGGEEREPVDLEPRAIAARAQAATPARMNAMGRTPHNRGMELVDSHEIGPPTAQNPQGLRVLLYKLDNGLNIVLWEDHSAPVFAYQTWFGVGSRHERPGSTGIAHLFEHLMFKETKNLSEGEFDRIMESHGAQTNAATWLDWTMYREELPAGNLELAVRLESDRIEHMILSAAQLESERDVVKNERRYRVDNDPEGVMFEVLYATAYTKHPYGWPTIGWMKDIEAISLDDCLAFYKKWYAPDNATVILVGDIDAQEALTLVNAYYGHLEGSNVEQPVLESEPNQVRERRRVIALELSSPKILYGYHTPALSEPDHAAIQVIHKILFGGQSGRLYRRLVVDSELASDASAWVGEFTYAGLYEILITLKRDTNPDSVEAIVVEEMIRLASEPVGQDELDKATNQLEVQFLRNAQSVGDRAYGLGHYAVTAGSFKTLFEVTDRYREVTAEDVQKAARRHLHKNNRTAILGLPRSPDGDLP